MALHLHIHAGRRVRTIDLTPPSLRDQYKQLVARLMEIMERQSTHDDAQPGHPFYGNQYTDVVLGPKPTEAKSKGVKNIVHELLTSGHPFSFEELKAATGAKLDQQLHNAINELKAGKHAAGALGIVKIGPGQYQVVKPNGEVAKALPKAEAELPDLLTPEEKAQEPAKEAPLPNPPAEAPPIAPSPVSAPPSGDLLAPAKAPATKMTKAEADKVYEQTLLDLTKQVADGYTQGKSTLPESAQLWKEGKAHAMAQWSANTTGQDHKPKPVEVFKEDKQLVFDLSSAYLDNKDDPAPAVKGVIEEWKKKTQEAKNKPASAPAATPTPKPKEPEPEKPAPKFTAEALSGPLSFEPPATLVPEGHKGITGDDFVTQPGHSEPAYVKGISEIHKKLHAVASDAVSNKKTVQSGLEKRLVASPHFQNMREQYKAKHSGNSYHNGSLEAQIISTWAGSSGDHHDTAVSAQLACRDVFKMNPAHVETAALGSITKHGGNEDAVHKAAAQEYGIDVSTPAKLESYKKGMQDFMLAQYHETQDRFKELGITELHLVRGMKIGTSSAEAKLVNLKLQPASSFSTAHSTAYGFSGGHSMFIVKVPTSQVLGSFITGYGCTGESEVVVLNHENLKAIQVGGKHAQSATGMASHIKQNAHQLGAAKTSTSVQPPASSPSTPAPSQAYGINPPPAGTGSLAKQAFAHAESGDLQSLLDMQKKLVGQTNVPKTKKYIKELIESHKAALAKSAAQAKAATPSKPAPVTVEGVKKNAHYYKKLKEKIMAHKVHSAPLYNGLKSAGQSHEQILKTYNDIYEKQYGEQPA